MVGQFSSANINLQSVNARYVVFNIWRFYFIGFRRRSLSDLSKRGRSKRSYWIDNPASDNEGVEYTVYQIEDIEGRLSSPKSEVFFHILSMSLIILINVT